MPEGPRPLPDLAARVFAAAPAVLFAMDLDGVLTQAIGRGMDASGLRAEDAVGRSVFDLYAGEPEILAGVRQALRGTPLTLSLRSNGRCYHTSFTPLCDEGGALIGVAGVGVDVTASEEATRSLGESERRFRTLTEVARDVIVEITPETRLLYGNPRLREMLGYEPADLLSRRLLDLVHPEDLERVEAARERSSRERSAVDVLCRVRHRDGAWRWIEARVSPFETSSGELRGVLLAQDVTERMRAAHAYQAQAEEEARIAELSRRLAAVGPEGLDPIVVEALELIAEVGEADRARFLAIGASPMDADTYFWARPGVPPPRPEPPDEVGPRYRWTRSRLDTGESLMVVSVEDLPPEAAFERRRMAAAGLRSVLAVPVRDGTRIAAVLALDRLFEERAWTPRQMAQARLLAELLAGVLRRHRADREARQNEQRLRLLAEHANDVVCEIDQDGQWRYASRNFEELAGYGFDEVRGMNVLDLAHPDDVELVKALRRSIAAGVGVEREVFRFRHKSDGWRWVELTAARFEIGMGEVRTAFVLRDVSARERRQHELEQRLALETELAELSRAFLGADADELELTLRRGLGRAAAIAGADRVTLVSSGSGDAGTLAVREWLAEGVRPSALRPDRRVYGWAFRKLIAGATLRVDRLDDLPEEAALLRADLEASGVSSYLGLSISVGGRAVCILSFHRIARREPWSDHDIAMLRLIGGLFATAVGRRQAERSLSESEERYRALAENSRDPILEFGDGGLVRYASPRFPELLGYDREQCAGFDFAAILHPADVDVWRERFEAAEASGEASGVAGLYRARHRDGSWLYLDASLRFFRISNGERRAVCVLRDATERHLAQLALERQLELETRVAEFSRRFVAIPVEETDAAIRESLEEVARLGGVEHAFFVFLDPVRAEESRYFEWCDAGVAPLLEPTAASEKVDLPWYRREIAQGRAVRFACLADLPPEAEAERAAYTGRGVRSGVGIPLRSGDRTVGYLGFEGLREGLRWTDEALTLLPLVGEIFLGAVRRLRAEEELRDSHDRLLQSQKMEAIGTLAGGIAHDFNNQLMVIQGNARFVRNRSDGDGDLDQALIELERAGEHCARLTRSLLAFSRQGPSSPAPLEVGEALVTASELLTPILPRTIDFRVEVEDRHARVVADPTQLQQVLVNLAVNARDAMEGGGRLRIAARVRSLDAPDARSLGLGGPGRFVQLTVEDTGIGMSEDVRARVFEPFFTTKPQGKGTGLGLATVYGIVRRSGGTIQVESTPRVGSVFRVLLPVAEEGIAQESVWLDRSPQVLLVEDEGAVRRVLRRALMSRGYAVHEAADGMEALRIAEGLDGGIDLLVSDVVLPRLGGQDLALRLRREVPGMPVLFVTGFAGDSLRRGSDLSRARILSKPFTARDFEEALDQLLPAS